jgi:hypothetical protein
VAACRPRALATSVFAAPEDWAATELGDRIGRAATKLAVILHAGVGDRIVDNAWAGYQHQFAGNATRAAHTTADVDFDSPLMRLAAGGTTRPTPSTGKFAGGAQDERGPSGVLYPATGSRFPFSRRRAETSVNLDDPARRPSSTSSR